MVPTFVERVVYMRLLSEAVAEDLCRSSYTRIRRSSAFFSEQDTRNGAELAQTANLKGPRGLVSICRAIRPS